MQEKETANNGPFAEIVSIPDGRLIALDPGTKRIGIAVSDKMRLTTRPLEFIERKSWKKLLSNIREIVSEYDAQALVVGLPLESDGGESEMSAEARSMARKFALSLEIPVFLQDERVTSYEAKGRLWAAGVSTEGRSRGLADSEAAAIILSDFIDRLRSFGQN